MIKNIDIQIELVPDELASVFVNLGDVDQSIFFNRLAEKVNTCGTPFDIQLQAIVSNGELSDDGLRIMRLIGEYAND